MSSSEAVFWLRVQAEKDARNAAERFSGIAFNDVTGRWDLWRTGALVGAVDDCDLATSLIPLLQGRAA